MNVNPPSAAGSVIAPAFSEEALALAFADAHRDELRYVAAWNKWLIYDGRAWKVDEKRKVFTLSRNLCRLAAVSANKQSEAKRLASYRTVMAVVAMAGADQRIAAGIEDWDADPWLLNTPDGVVDLRNGKMRAHDPGDYMTKITKVAPDLLTPTPIWDAFLDKATAEDKDYQDYIARALGYCLTGVTREHAMFFLYGTGGNGKGVLMSTVANVMGDYHRAAPIETFTETNVDRHPTELAMLRGARLVTATETEEGRRWAESRIKALTGGDRISARFMRQDFFEFDPQFKLAISGNHKPGLRAPDEAIRRRLAMWPFTVTITDEEKDTQLTAKLEQEWAGVLAWMIEGCLDWRRQGLAPPKAVISATETYLQDEDPVGKWIDQRLIKDVNGWTAFDQLYSDWKAWAENNGEKINTSKWFSGRLESLKFVRERKQEGRGFVGVTLHPSNEEPAF